VCFFFKDFLLLPPVDIDSESLFGVSPTEGKGELLLFEDAPNEGGGESLFVSPTEGKLGEKSLLVSPTEGGKLFDILLIE